jgi:hypothetical protein
MTDIEEEVSAGRDVIHFKERRVWREETNREGR